MHENPTFSVVIPVFNSASTVKTAIDSIINQTYPVNEIIVVNNNSTDNLSEILQPLASKVILRNCEKQGVSSARNFGVEIATSDYIAFLDADDYWFPEKLEMQTATMRASQSDLSLIGCYADFLISGKRIGRSLKSKSDTTALADFKRFGNLPCITSSWIVSRREYLALGGMDPNVSTAEDFEFVCRAVANGFEFRIVRQALVGYSISSGSVTHVNYLEQYFRAHFYQNLYFNHLTNEKFEDFVVRIRPMSSIWRKARSSRLIRLAMISYSQGRMLRSIIFVTFAILLSPLSALMKAKRQFHWK